MKLNLIRLTIAHRSVSRAGPACGFLLAIFLPVSLFGASGDAAARDPFTFEQVLNFPFPDELTAAATGSRIAWAVNSEGRRNIWVAEGPDFKARQLTDYKADDGQELTSVQLSDDGQFVVYVRGGEHAGSSDRSVPINPSSSPQTPRVQIWSVAFEGGDPKLIGDGDNPVVAAATNQIAFLKDGVVMSAPLDGTGTAKRLFYEKRKVSEIVWSPDGRRLAFVSNRGPHGLIGIYADDKTPIIWLAPSTSKDNSPRWSPDGRRIAFVRMPGNGGTPDPILTLSLRHWSIWTADTATGEGHELWRSDRSPFSSRPSTGGGVNLNWAAKDLLVFASDHDGWHHLYSIRADGGEARLLTPGNFEIDHVTLNADRSRLFFSGNAGPGKEDLDRRHAMTVSVDQADMHILTPGKGLESTPVLTGDGQHVAYIGATAQMPPLVTVRPLNGGQSRRLAADTVPSDFPEASLVAPKQVFFEAADGQEVTGQLFLPPPSQGKHPAVVFVHGGPKGQTLSGWHNNQYHSYALNQYLANRGFVVLSVNYRMGTGYGMAYMLAAARRDMAEYQDVVAGGEYLRNLPQVDGGKIGIYGASYGGYLTAMALSHNSNLFAAGVDLCGVHDWAARAGRAISLYVGNYEKPADLNEMMEVMWNASPVSAVATWKSPVLFIHGDDDRNVAFKETVDLVRRLEDQTNVNFEVIVLPNETHHFMLHSNMLRVGNATVQFLEKNLRLSAATVPPEL